MKRHTKYMLATWVFVIALFFILTLTFTGYPPLKVLFLTYGSLFVLAYVAFKAMEKTSPDYIPTYSSFDRHISALDHTIDRFVKSNTADNFFHRLSYYYYEGLGNYDGSHLK